MNLVTISAFVLAALACLTRSEETTPSYPDVTSFPDATDTTYVDTETTRSEVGLTTEARESVDTTPYPSETENVNDGTSTTSDDAPTTVPFITDTTDGTSTTNEDQFTTTELDVNDKVNIPEVANTEVPKERKPVVEPLFIKKYWPLLCFKTKCAARHSSTHVPLPHSEEVRTDLEESRSSNDVLRGIMDDIIVDRSSEENQSESDESSR